MTPGICLCGCGKPTSIIKCSRASKGQVRGEYRRYVHGHHVVRGQPASPWKGGITWTVKGYRIRADDHRFEHIIVVENAMGKPLRRTASVHHINGVRDDNRNENLVACDSHSYHMLLHSRQRAMEACGHPDWMRCKGCGEYGDPAQMRVRPQGANAPRYTHHNCPAHRRKEQAA